MDPASKPLAATSDRFGWADARFASARTIAIAAVGLAVAIALWSFGDAMLAKNRQLEQDTELSERAAQITNLVLQEGRLERDSVLDVLKGDQTAPNAGKWNDTRALLSDAIARADELNLNEQDRHAVRQIASDYRVYVDGYMRVLGKIRSGQIRTVQQANEQIAIYKDSAHRMEATSAAINARALRRLGKMT
jgi:hypothetical protein